jgi:hypothetical protein
VYPSTLQGPPARIAAGHNAPVYSVDCAVSGALISGGADCKLNQSILDKDGNWDTLRTIVAHVKPINTVKWNADGKNFFIIFREFLLPFSVIFFHIIFAYLFS